MLDRPTLQALHARHWPAVEAHIGAVVGRLTPAASPLHEFLRYHLETGGKRLRALIPLLVAEALGAPPHPFYPFAAACELTHNATLVHDDLQDGDTHRRGRPTVWAQFSPAQALNLGDALFHHALALTAGLELPPARCLALVERQLAATLAVIDGQAREYAFRAAGPPALADYVAMVERKTAALFALPLAGAAELADAPPKTVAALAEAARPLGVLFQIQDDLLDLYGDKGRAAPAGDIREGKYSLPVVFTLERATPADRRALLDLLHAPPDAPLGPRADAARALFAAYGAPAFAFAEMSRRRAAALATLEAAAVPQPLVALVADLAEAFLLPIAPLAAALAGPSAAPAVGAPRPPGGHDDR